MLDKLDGYSDDDLDNIADENENWDPESGSTLEEASDSMRRFIADFEECTGDDRDGVERADGIERTVGVRRTDDELSHPRTGCPPSRKPEPTTTRSPGETEDNQMEGQALAAAAFFFGGGTPMAGAGSASAGHLRRDTIDRVRSSFIATSSS